MCPLRLVGRLGAGCKFVISLAILPFHWSKCAFNCSRINLAPNRNCFHLIGTCHCCPCHRGSLLFSFFFTILFALTMIFRKQTYFMQWTWNENCKRHTKSMAKSIKIATVNTCLFIDCNPSNKTNSTEVKWSKKRITRI